LVSDKNKVQEVVKAVIFKEGKFLLQLRDNDPAIPYPNSWAFFGGGVDKGEKHKEAMKRELKEELGWCPKEFEYLMTVRNTTANCNITHYFAECTVPNDQLCLGEGQAMAWFSLYEISELDNKPRELENVIKVAKNRIASS
jgi:mutator protein MutT